MNLQWNSLRTRFLLAVLLWVALGIGAIWLSSTRLFALHVEAQYHEELEVHIDELAGLFQSQESGHPALNRPLSDPRYLVPLSGFYWQITADGSPPLRSPSMTRGALDETVAHSPEVMHRVEDGPTGPAITYGLVRKAADGRDIHFVIATDQSELDRVIDRFTRELTFWLAALAALLLATGIAIISFGMRPLNRLANATARLRVGKSARLEGQYPAEIAPLAEDLNAYIAQNTEMVARARVQAGNLAHSLRTPLAVITDEAERLAEAGKAPDSADVLLNQAHIMVQQIEYQLARTRSAAGAHIPGAGGVLPDLLTPILAAMRRLHSGKTFVLKSRLLSPTSIACDHVDLSELLSILLDNAGKWAASKITVEIDQTPDGVALAIRDDGPGMTSAQIEQAFEIGRRFDENVPGTGLGLAIAKDICDAIGARIWLESRSRPDNGLTAHVIL